LLIREHGRDVTFSAAQRADANLKKGDLYSVGFWIAVVHAIKHLECEEPREGETVH
jgi:hypothetical protein